MRSAHGIALVAALAAVTLTALTDTPSRAGPTAIAKEGQPPLVGIVWGLKQQRLVRVNPASLRPRGKWKVALDGHTWGWSFSPSGTQVVLGRDGIPELRFADARLLRRLGPDLEIGDWRASVAATAWVRPDLLVAVVAASGCCAVGTTTVVWIDPVRRQILRRQSLDGALVRVAKAPMRIALLLAPPSGDSEGLSPIGPSRLAVVDAEGVRVAPVGLSSGVEHGANESDPEARIVEPGLAVDSARARAYVVAADGEVAEIDLDTLAVADHRTALLERRLSAPAKVLSGSERHAVVVPGGRIAIWGTDYATAKDAQGNTRVVARPAGLRLVDPDGWTGRLLESRADSARAVTGELVATGPGVGLEGFGFNGDLWFRTLRGRNVWLEEAYGTRLFVQIGSSKRLKVVDLVRRRVVGERKSTPPWLLVDGAWTPWS